MAESHKAEWFQAQALQCIGLALRAKDPRVKRLYTLEAQRWLHLAELNTDHIIRDSAAAEYRGVERRMGSTLYFKSPSLGEIMFIDVDITPDDDSEIELLPEGIAELTERWCVALNRMRKVKDFRPATREEGPSCVQRYRGVDPRRATAPCRCGVYRAQHRRPVRRRPMECIIGYASLAAAISACRNACWRRCGHARGPVGLRSPAALSSLPTPDTLAQFFKQPEGCCNLATKRRC
jgi:hypothetical protein